MELRDHVQVTGGALKRWFIAQLQDALCVGVLWLVGLMIIGVPWAPLWALIATVFQFVPHLGPVISLVGPSIAASVSGDFMRLIYVFILYAIIAVIDGLVLQPYLMRRTARVPIWASILAPIILGMAMGTFGLGFVGVLIAAPLLAIYYAYRARSRPAPPEYEIQRPGEWTPRPPPI